MARPAPIRLAGMIAATATFAVLATEATAQDANGCPPQGGTTCSNDQRTTGDAIAVTDVNLDVALEQLTVTTTATGNALVGGIVGTSGAVQSVQAMSGAARAESTVTSADLADVDILGVTTEARANYVQASTDGAAFAIDADQSATGQGDGTREAVDARTYIDAGTTHMTGGAFGAATAVANGVIMGGPSSSVTGTIRQSADTGVFGETVANIQYIPAPAVFTSEAVVNSVQTNTTGASHQDLTIRQTNAPATVQARTDVYVDNAWNLASRAHATGNRAALYNAGGSQLATTDQTNQSRVIAYNRTRTNLQGQTVISARAVANEVIAGNNDIYLELDNTQLNTGGVEATAVSTGVNGYDTYVGAEAVGNSVTGYACSQCGGQVNFTNNQVNSGPVTATSTVNIQSGRAAVVGANAVGNSATFYISRPGG